MPAADGRHRKTDISVARATLTVVSCSVAFFGLLLKPYGKGLVEEVSSTSKRSILHEIADKGAAFSSLLQLVLQTSRGTNVNPRDENGDSPLALAARSSALLSVLLLLR